MSVVKEIPSVARVLLRLLRHQKVLMSNFCQNCQYTSSDFASDVTGTFHRPRNRFRESQIYCFILSSFPAMSVIIIYFAKIHFQLLPIVTKYTVLQFPQYFSLASKLIITLLFTYQISIYRKANYFTIRLKQSRFIIRKSNLQKKSHNSMPAYRKPTRSTDLNRSDLAPQIIAPI